jgi:hypothetical protein
MIRTGDRLSNYMKRSLHKMNGKPDIKLELDPPLEIGWFPDFVTSGYIHQIVEIGLENYLQWHIRIKEIRIQSL